jgi:hypothetical protein
MADDIKTTTETKIEKAPILKSAAPTGGTAPEVKLPVVKPEKPDAIKERPKVETFSDDFTDVASFQTEQLPERTAAGERGKIVPDKETAPKDESTEKVEEVKEEEKKEEDKQEEKPGLPKFLKPPTDAKGKEGEAKTDDKKATVKPIVPPDKKGLRDYTGYTPEQVSAFKKMSDEGYTLATQLIKENRELSKLRETTYMQHEHGYVLDPGFQQIRQNVVQANKEAEYLKQQLLAMDGGADFVPITGYDTRTGEFVKGTPVKPSKAVEEDVRSMMQNAYRVANELGGQLQTYPQRYKQQVQQDMQEIERVRREQFGWVSNPELLKYTIEVQGLGEVPLQRIKDDFVNMYPPYMRAHPAVQITGDLMIAMRIKDAELQEARASKQTDNTIEEERTRVEPKSTQKPKNLNGTAVHGVKEFRDDLATL